ncbi:MAG: Nif3-like dinuclear metal center hexameric protein [Clostridiales bacterium]|nr:Nif3-like dinuclear metal center hexameric protein [Clostridiales bacterium]MCF8021421.1 Nif3-like dinuclear metal center hexameric protein [Clostridiales bacterium]
MPRAKEIVSIIEELAPSHFAESWDNCGWQVGNPHDEVNKVLTALDVDENVYREAVQKNVQLIICHHPLIMKKINSIRLDKPSGRLLGDLIHSGIGVYAAHTNLDITNGGVNDVLTAKLALQETAVLHETYHNKYLKLVVFVPESSIEDVLETLGQQGAGWIGNYSDCTYQVKGTGTFRPQKNTNPYIGEHDKLECVQEIRLETIILAENKDRVIDAVIKSHPYEEVAYDLYPLALEGEAQGLGRIGYLKGSPVFSDFIQYVKDVLNISYVRYGGKEEDKVNCVAVCGGAGAGLWEVAVAKGADVLVTGDIKYHPAQEMLENGLKFIDAGHHGTEKIIVDHLYDYLQEKCKERSLEIEVLTSQENYDPFKVR